MSKMFKFSKKEAKATASLKISNTVRPKNTRPSDNSFLILQRIADDAEPKDVVQAFEQLKVTEPRGSKTTTQLKSQPDIDGNPGLSALEWRNPPQSSRPLGEPAARARTAIGSLWQRSTNWRAPRDRQALAARWAGENTIGTTRTRGTYRGGPRTMGGVLHSDLIKGSITWHWDIRPYKGTSIPDDDPRIEKHTDGSRCLKKGRYWLIVDRTSDTVWGDTDLHERRHWAEKGGQASAQRSPANEVLSIRWLNTNDGQMRGQAMRMTMVAHFTEVMKRDINEEPVRFVGAIANEDIPIICEKARRYISK